MKVFFLTEGTRTSAASRIRVYKYLDRLRTSGALQWRAASFTSEGYCRRIVGGRPAGAGRRLLEKLYQSFSLARLVLGCLDCRAVFIQRILLPVWLQRLVAALSRSLVYDFDDAVYLGGRRQEKRFASQAGLASRVLAVSRAAAAEVVSRGADPEKVVVLPSPLDCGSYRVRAGLDPGRFTVGWIGSPATTPYLEAVWEQLAGFADSRPEVRFLFIGARPFAAGGLSGCTRFEPWTPEAERELLCRMDVGLMPLEDDDWCRGKGGYKLIQYMAAGVATLCSPVGANLEVVQDGSTGMFVRGPGDWGPCLEILYSDPQLCDSLGRAGRLRALELYDYERTTPVFLRVLQEAAGKTPA
ncbi:MAG: glycosyltransferase family 4 protein [Candidatus Glassbacteria bacterium]|nr:glycosyltransferase family 4 protein [Candidatus Glassbacteria bacterium]